MLVGAFILLAVIKPWQATAAPATDLGSLREPYQRVSSSGAAASGGAAPTPVAPTLDPLRTRKECQDPDVWRLVTMERSGPLVGRSLLPVTLVAATGPADPAIVPQSVHTGSLLAFGYCMPTVVHADIAAAEEAVAIWRSAAGGRLVRLANERVLDASLASVGEVYLGPPLAGPAPASGQPDTSWPEGRYVFETPPDVPGGEPGWFAFVFASTAAPSAAPAGAP